MDADLILNVHPSTRKAAHIPLSVFLDWNHNLKLNAQMEI